MNTMTTLKLEQMDGVKDDPLTILGEVTPRGKPMLALLSLSDDLRAATEMIGLLRDQLQFHISGYAVTRADEGRSHSLCIRAQDLLIRLHR